MNDNSTSEHRARSPRERTGADEVARPRRRRFFVRAGLALLVGLGALAAVRQLAQVPPSPGGLCEWTLRFPGPSPGATFRTAPGDDIRRLLDILLVDAEADWHSVLKKTGTVRVELAHFSAAPLGVRLLWRFWAPDGSPPPDKIGRSLITMEVRRISDEPARYVLVHIDSPDDETVAGTFDEYPSVQDAVLDDLAERMEAIQAETAVGRNG